MYDKIVLFAIGLTVGVASFAAIGTVTALLMSEVQQRVSAQTQPPLTSYAQYRPITDPIAR